MSILTISHLKHKFTTSHDIGMSNAPVRQLLSIEGHALDLPAIWSKILNSDPELFR